MMDSPFPRCSLFGTNVVRSLPAECPMRAENPADELRAKTGATFWHPEDGDPYPALASAAVYKSCTDCIDRILAHPHIKFLRGRS